MRNEAGLSAGTDGGNKMNRTMILTAAVLALGGCGEADKPKAKEKAAALAPGEYEVTIKVDSLKSTDKTSPATKAKAGAAGEPVRTCVPTDGKLDGKLFGEASDSCTQQSAYMSRGRMSFQFQCNRPGNGGLSQLVDGEFKAESFEAKVTTSTFFTGSGDYEMARTFTGKRVGDCSPAKEG
jgi:hypothetical protein